MNQQHLQQILEDVQIVLLTLIVLLDLIKVEIGVVLFVEHGTNQKNMLPWL